jgi:hypothetical protein
MNREIRRSADYGPLKRAPQQRRGLMSNTVVLRIPGQGGRDSEIDSVSIPKLIRSRFRDEVGHGFRF